MRRRLAIFILPIVLVLALIRFLPTQAATLDQIRLSWQHDPKTTMTVMWRTESNLAPRVQYGPTTGYGSEATGTSQAAVLDGYFYNTVELAGLTPNTAYHYRVSGAGGAWSSDFTFKTAPAGPADFSFTVFGDNGLDTTSSGNPRRVKDLVLAQQPALHLIAGDLTYADGERNPRSAWEQWFTEMGRLSQTIPVLPAIGNHERDSDVKFSSGELFYKRSLALPPENNEDYYSFDYGDVHFTIINSDEYSSLRPGRPQYEWIRQDLAATTKRFKIAVFHHMVYSSGSRHAVLQDVQNNLSPLFDQYDVDLVFTGHNHLYERTYPLRYGSFENPMIGGSGTAYTNPDATVYVVTGGGGRGLHDFNNPQPAWSAVRCKCYEIVRVEVDDAGALNVRTIGIDGSTVDQFTITKTVSGMPGDSISGRPETESPTIVITPSPTTPASNPSSQKPIQGFTLTVWSRSALDTATARESLDKLKAANANYVALAPFWYQDTKASTRIYRRDSKTATDDSLRAAIRYAKSLGLKVALKPMVDSREGTWRGNFEPTDSTAWFSSYKDMLLGYARLAQEQAVDYLVVGTEFTKLTPSPYTAKWRELITAVREIYRGPLTYAANWGTTASGEYQKVEFWDTLDAIGIDAYFPVANSDSPTVAGVIQAWASWASEIKALADRFNKPVVFTEIGYLSCDGAGIKPWEYPCKNAVDLQEQATLYEGLLQFWADKPWLQGFLGWRWDVDPDKGGERDGDYLVQNKLPVLDVLKRFWTASALPPPPQASPIQGEEDRRGSPPLVGGVRGGGQGTGTTSTPPTTSPTSTSSTTSPTASSGGGGGVGLVTTPFSMAPTFPVGSTVRPATTQSLSTLPTTNYQLRTRLPFAYGQPRLPIWQERVRAWHELAVPLRAHFKGAIPLDQKHWPYYINAYLYGGYPVAAIARSIELSGKTVHPAIPWSAWQRSADYKKYITR